PPTASSRARASFRASPKRLDAGTWRSFPSALICSTFASRRSTGPRICSATRMCCGRAGWCTMSTQTESRSAFLRCRSNGPPQIPRRAGKFRSWAPPPLPSALNSPRKNQPTTLREVFMTRYQDIYPGNRVILREVGLRDGLQLVKKFPSTAAKQQWIRDEYAAGVRHFEVGSFLPAKTFPQFVDVREIVATIAALPGAHGVALALNERGVNEAMESGVGEIATVVSATEEHSQANANRSRESAIANVKRMVDLRNAGTRKPVVNAAISMALGCSIAGEVDPNEVIRIAEKLFEGGVDMVAVADTVGYAGPKQVGDLTRAVVKIAGSKPVCVHLHDTRGMGIGNASAELDAAAHVLDAPPAGLDGPPFAP